MYFSYNKLSWREEEIRFIQMKVISYLDGAYKDKLQQ